MSKELEEFREDCEKRFNKCLKRISGDGQTIKEILDIFNEVIEDHERISAFLDNANEKFHNRIEEIQEFYKDKIKEGAEKEYKKKVVVLKRTIALGLKKYMDEELEKLTNSETEND